MGRDDVWVAVVGGLAGGADFILSPEMPVDIDAVCHHLKRRTALGKDFSIIVVSEGVVMPEVIAKEAIREVDQFGHVRLDRRGVGETLSRIIEDRTGMETRVTVLGHVQRGGSPSAFDRVWATRLGVAAVDYLHERVFGVMVAVQGNEIKPVSVDSAIGHMKTVDPSLYKLAELFY
jgi:6-phosphofructokinase 1